jgi:hypothetical protein
MTISAFYGTLKYAILQDPDARNCLVPFPYAVDGFFVKRKLRNEITFHESGYSNIRLSTFLQNPFR